MTTQHRAFVEHFKLIFFVDSPQVVTRVEITPKAMVQCFDAQMTPQSFLDIYRRHQVLLHDAAVARLTADGAPIVLDTDDIAAFMLKTAGHASPAAPITLRTTQRPGKTGRLDGFAPGRVQQDTRLAAFAGA